MQLNILRNLETWSDKNKTAFAIKYVLQIPHRYFTATGTESKIGDVQYYVFLINCQQRCTTN